MDNMRQLLALIALLTGLAALTEPVSAAETGVASVAVAQGVACHAQVSPMAVHFAKRPMAVAPWRMADPERKLSVTTPAVFLRADRARE
jgi:hypothetical protein